MEADKIKTSILQCQTKMQPFRSQIDPDISENILNASRHVYSKKYYIILCSHLIQLFRSESISFRGKYFKRIYLATFQIEIFIETSIGDLFLVIRMPSYDKSNWNFKRLEILKKVFDFAEGHASK